MGDNKRKFRNRINVNKRLEIVEWLKSVLYWALPSEDWSGPSIFIKRRKAREKWSNKVQVRILGFTHSPQPPENMKKNMQIRKKVTVEVILCIVLLTCIRQGDVI